MRAGMERLEVVAGAGRCHGRWHRGGRSSVNGGEEKDT